MKAISVLIITIMCSQYGCSNPVNKEQYKKNSTKSRIEKLHKKQDSLQLNVFDTTIVINDSNYRIIIENLFFNDPLKGKVIYSSKVKISRNNSFLFKKTYDKYSFGIVDTSFLNKAVLFNFSFSDFKQNKFELFSTVNMPETDWFYAFDIYVDLHGKEVINEISDENMGW